MRPAMGRAARRKWGWEPIDSRTGSGEAGDWLCPTGAAAPAGERGDRQWGRSRYERKA